MPLEVSAASDDSNYADFLTFVGGDAPQKAAESRGTEVTLDETSAGDFEVRVASPKSAAPVLVRGVTKDTVASSEDDETLSDGSNDATTKKTHEPAVSFRDAPSAKDASALAKEADRQREAAVAAALAQSSTRHAADGLATSKSWRALEAQAKLKAAAGEKYVLPADAPEATRYFDRQVDVQAAEIRAKREAVNSKPYEKPLPVDHFTKLAEAETAAKAKSMRDLARSQAPEATLYFTAKAEEEKKAALAKHAEGHPDMSVATKYFNKLAEEKKAEEERKAREEPEPMPAAIQKFTSEAYAERAKKKAEIQKLHDNPAEMAPGQAFFTQKMMEEKARRDAENRVLRENPPPTSEATAYFAKKEEERKAELERQMQEPAPAAVEYFSKMADEEQKRAKEAMARSDARNGEASVATAYFERQKSVKEEEIRAAREAVNSKTYEKPLPVDHFTKMSEEETAAKAKSMRDLARSQAPEATLYFTAKAEEEKARKLAEFEKGHPEMSVATKYFNRLELEKKAEEERKAREDPEPMPAAIQKFTTEAYAERAKKKAEIQKLRDNPTEMAPGQAYFTKKMMDEKEARDEENRALRENPPPTSEATAYFAKKEEQRKRDLAAQANEPAPAAVEFFTNKAREEQARAKEAMQRASARGEEKAEATAHFERKEKEREREIEMKRNEAWERRLKSDGKSKIDWKSIHKQKAPEVNLYYTVDDEAMTAPLSDQ